MTTVVALLRAINLGSHKKIAMADLRAWLGALGYDDPRTLLQTGNLVVRTPDRPSVRLTGDLEAHLAREAVSRLALDTDFFVRTAAEWRQTIEANPFGAMARTDPGHLVLLCLKDAPGAAAVGALQATIAGPEIVRATDRHLYVTYPDGIGVSKLTIARIEKALGTRATGRNWNTVLKIGALLDEVEASR